MQIRKVPRQTNFQKGWRGSNPIVLAHPPAAHKSPPFFGKIIKWRGRSLESLLAALVEQTKQGLQQRVYLQEIFCAFQVGQARTPSVCELLPCDLPQNLLSDLLHCRTVYYR